MGMVLLERRGCRLRLCPVTGRAPPWHDPSWRRPRFTRRFNTSL